MIKNTFKIIVLSFLFVLIFESNAFAFESVKFAIKEICGHMQGNLGGLLMTVAGVGGITAAAFGNMRASHSMIVVGVGAAALSAVLSLYFPKAADLCHGNGKLQGGGGAAARIANVARTDDNQDVLAQAKAFDDAALTIATGGEADFTNHVELQQTDNEDIEFDPGTEEFAEGF